jgi:ATP synthase protein I
MLTEVSLQNPTIRRMLVLQACITVGFAVIAGVISGQHGAVSAVLGGLTNVFASLIFVFVANLGLRKANLNGNSGLWALLRAELVKLVFIGVQLGIVVKTYSEVSFPALLATFIVTLLAWRVTLLGQGMQGTQSAQSAAPRASASSNTNSH